MAKIIDFEKERAERGRIFVDGCYIDPKKMKKKEIECLGWFAERIATTLYFLKRKDFTC